jgi:zinc-ribbon domain
MRSIKPGRAPSWGGVIGGIIAAIFGVFWIGMASSGDAPPFVIVFGVVFILCALGSAIYNFYNATSRNRFSDWDLTEPHEERDPLDPSSRHSAPRSSAMLRRPTSKTESIYCPFCGAAVKEEFAFCPRCGKQLAKS